MELINLTMTPDKIMEYNDNVTHCINEYPESFNDSWYIKSQDDLILPYNKLGLTPEDIDKYKYIIDDLNDFTGVYVPRGYFSSIDHYMNESISDEFYYNDKFKIRPYGISDNASQIIKYFQDIEKSENIDFERCVIMMTPNFKSDQPERGGFRPWKWGEYIGVKTLQYEYLYNEDDDVQLLWNFHLYHVE